MNKITKNYKEILTITLGLTLIFNTSYTMSSDDEPEFFEYNDSDCNDRQKSLIDQQLETINEAFRTKNFAPIVKLVNENGMPINKVFSSVTMLEMAIQSNNLDAIKFLLDSFDTSKVDLLFNDQGRGTPITYAEAIEANPAIIKLLEEYTKEKKEEQSSSKKQKK